MKDDRRIESGDTFVETNAARIGRRFVVVIEILNRGFAYVDSTSKDFVVERYEFDGMRYVRDWVEAGWTLFENVERIE